MTRIDGTSETLAYDPPIGPKKMRQRHPYESTEHHKMAWGKRDAER